MELIAGIDLGTTNSEISVMTEDGELIVVPVDGSPVLPSCVGLDRDGRLLVGRAALNQLVADPEATVSSVKRHMGEDAQLALRDRQLSPEEISAFILAELRRRAAEHLGRPVDKAVITVPAYFNDRQRKATVDAGTLAGLDVVRIINEPTAAAIAYESDHTSDQRILVYDLGGGTFDASLVVVEKGVVEVRASHGDTHLGGDDFDNLLWEHVLGLIGRGQDEIRRDPKARRRLLRAVEAAKRTLSDEPYARVREEYLVGDIHVDVEVTREDYEQLILPLVRQTLESVHRCLRDATMLPSAVNRILLAGGATRTPLVQQQLAEHFGIDPRHEVDPDLIVSMGAGMQAGRIAGAQTKSLLVDITPHSFGTSAVGEYEGELQPGVYVPVIRRNTPLPVHKSEAFVTMVDNQEKVEVNIYEGEQPLAEDNTFVGKFMVERLSKTPAGNVILLNLALDLNGMLKVTATEKKTGLSKSVVMDTKATNARLDLEQAQRNVAELLEPGGGADGEIAAPLQRNEQVAKARELRQRAEQLVETVNDEDADELRALLQQTREAIARNDWDRLVELNDSLTDMLFYLED
ncbi:MAG: Hsp70 family protein [Chitinivibrionales bacterium]|nr:Hsp70 family protein [Chitinivibrionales bacterium]